MKRKIAGGLLAVYAASTLLFSVFLPEGTSQNLTGADHSLSPSEFGVLCISTVYPGAVSDVSDSRDNEEAGADQAVLTMKSLEALGQLAQGRATKIVVPSDLQGLAGLATSFKEIVNVDTPRTE